MNRTCALSLLGFLGALPLVFGCTADGGQTGEETQEPCKETKTALGLDEVSPLGFSAQALLGATGDGMTAAGAWVPVAGLPYGPESGPSTLSLTFGAMRTARFVKSEIGNSEEISLETCMDRVEVQVDATATTSGGALAESFPAVLSASSQDFVGMSELFEPTKITGAFAFDAQALGTKRFTRLTLSANWLLGDFSARLSAGIEDSSGSGPDSSVSFTDAPLACFAANANGAPGDCAQ